MPSRWAPTAARRSPWRGCEKQRPPPTLLHATTLGAGGGDMPTCVRVQGSPAPWPQRAHRESPVGVTRPLRPGAQKLRGMRGGPPLVVKPTPLGVAAGAAHGLQWQRTGTQGVCGVGWRAGGATAAPGSGQRGSGSCRKWRSVVRLPSTPPRHAGLLTDHRVALHRQRALRTECRQDHRCLVHHLHRVHGWVGHSLQAAGCGSTCPPWKRYTLAGPPAQPAGGAAARHSIVLGWGLFASA